MKTRTLTQPLVDTLNENKALQIIELNISPLTDIADYMIICTATSKRHAHALMDKLIATSKSMGISPLGVEGAETAEWILIDLGDAIVHIMLPEVRDFYALEKLWSTPEYPPSNSHF